MADDTPKEIKNPHPGGFGQGDAFYVAPPPPEEPASDTPDKSDGKKDKD